MVGSYVRSEVWTSVGWKWVTVTSEAAKVQRETQSVKGLGVDIGGMDRLMEEGYKCRQLRSLCRGGQWVEGSWVLKRGRQRPKNGSLG